MSYLYFLGICRCSLLLFFSIRTYFYITHRLFFLLCVVGFSRFVGTLYSSKKKKEMRSSKSSFLTKQRMKICRSITVQDASPTSDGTKYSNDRALSTSNTNNDEW